jgi:hypothetical protein
MISAFLADDLPTDLGDASVIAELEAVGSSFRLFSLPGAASTAGAFLPAYLMRASECRR